MFDELGRFLNAPVPLWGLLWLAVVVWILDRDRVKWIRKIAHTVDRMDCSETGLLPSRPRIDPGGRDLDGPPKITDRRQEEVEISAEGLYLISYDKTVGPANRTYRAYRKTNNLRVSNTVRPFESLSPPSVFNDLRRTLYLFVYDNLR